RVGVVRGPHGRIVWTSRVVQRKRRSRTVLGRVGQFVGRSVVAQRADIEVQRVRGAVLVLVGQLVVCRVVTQHRQRLQGSDDGRKIGRAASRERVEVGVLRGARR